MQLCCRLKHSLWLGQVLPQEVSLLGTLVTKVEIRTDVILVEIGKEVVRASPTITDYITTCQ